MAVKASLKAIPQSQNKTEKIPSLRTPISGCLHLQTGFLGVTVSTHAYLHEQHFIFMWHPRLLQQIELQCDKKFHLRNRKVLIMAEASSLAKFLYIEMQLISCLNKIAKQTYMAMHVLLRILL